MCIEKLLEERHRHTQRMSRTSQRDTGWSHTRLYGTPSHRDDSRDYIPWPGQALARWTHFQALMCSQHLLVFIAPEAIGAYMTELNKWHAADKKDTELVKMAEDLVELSQATAFESQLARCLRKVPQLQFEAIEKYIGLYAKVSSERVLSQLWLEAQMILKSNAPKETVKKK